MRRRAKIKNIDEEDAFSTIPYAWRPGQKSRIKSRYRRRERRDAKNEINLILKEEVTK